jgi:transposase
VKRREFLAPIDAWATKQCRRVAKRYDKLAANYLAFVKLASIRIGLRANESAS